MSCKHTARTAQLRPNVHGFILVVESARGVNTCSAGRKFEKRNRQRVAVMLLPRIVDNCFLTILTDTTHILHKRLLNIYITNTTYATICVADLLELTKKTHYPT